MRDRIFALFGLLIVLLVIWGLSSGVDSEDSVPSPVLKAEVLGQGEPRPANIANIEEDSGIRLPIEVEDTPVDAIALKVIASGNVLAVDGFLQFAGNKMKILRPSVMNGVAHVGATELENLSEKKTAVWFFPEGGLPTIVIDKSVVQKEDEATCLELNVGLSKHVTVEAVDLSGQPVPGGKISVYGGYSNPGSEPFCDSNGKWSGVVYGDSTLELTVDALGYGLGNARVRLEENAASTVSVHLGRLLAYGLVLDRRERFTLMAISQVNSFTPGDRTRYADTISQIEEGAHINPVNEYVKWTVILETHFVEDWARDVEVTLTNKGDTETPVTMTIQYQHLVASEFELFRFPSHSWPLELNAVDVELSSSDPVALGVLPDFLVLGWREEDVVGGNIGVKRGRRVDTEAPIYRFFLPAGTYSIVELASPSREKLEAFAPTLSGSPKVSVPGGGSMPVQILGQLEAGWFCTHYVVQDNSGIPVAVGWIMREERQVGQSRFSIIPPSGKYKTRFFHRDRDYSLWMAPLAGGPLIEFGESLSVSIDRPAELISIVVDRQLIPN